MSVNAERVVTLKFNNGIEVIAEILDIDDQCISIKQPLQLVQVPMNNNQMGIGFAPITISGHVRTDAVGVFASSLMFLPIPANTDFIQRYMEQVSGIALPQKSIITG